MANLPVTQTQSSDPNERYAELLAEAIADGKRPSQLARELAKGDEAKARRLRVKFRALAYKPAFMVAAGQRAQAELVLGLIPAAQAVVRRAARGRTDSAKLVFAATGFHSDRVTHDHTGEIKISLNGMVRPELQETVDSTVVPDATVVED